MTNTGSNAINILQSAYEFLSLVLAKGLDEIRPELKYESSSPEYGVLRDIAEKYGVRDIDVLSKLESLGVLKRLYYDSIVTCPKCGSHRLQARFKCPRCGSRLLRKVTMVTHVSCGFIGVLESMQVVDGKYVCGKCGKPIERSGYKELGKLYACDSCGSRFDSPLPDFRCLDCDLVFDHRESEYITLYSYEVDMELARRMFQELLIEMIRVIAEENGFTVHVGKTIEGRSKYMHRVDVQLVKGAKHIVIDVVPNTELKMSQALSAMARIIDMNPNVKYYLLVPRDLIETELISMNVRDSIIGYSNAENFVQIVREIAK